MDNPAPALSEPQRRAPQGQPRSIHSHKDPKAVAGPYSRPALLSRRTQNCMLAHNCTQLLIINSKISTGLVSLKQTSSALIPTRTCSANPSLTTGCRFIIILFSKVTPTLHYFTLLPKWWLEQRQWWAKYRTIEIILSRNSSDAPTWSFKFAPKTGVCNLLILEGPFGPVSHLPKPSQSCRVPLHHLEKYTLYMFLWPNFNIFDLKQCFFNIFFISMYTIIMYFTFDCSTR